ncbi:MAG TPA: carboxypeptidase regulatory-like domain-containing protein [Thermoanaerobaculia bacterium]|nr:carboxypeptidase regulatory-like domain-containing protein [Thermoanaerobaculia bacterium]
MRKSLCVWLLVTLVAAGALAQATTATLRGKVTDDGGRGIANAEINAVSTATGFVHTVHSSPDGSYLLAGLPPGAYNIVVAAPGREPLQRELEVRLGQVLDVNFTLTGTLTLSEAVTVVGNQVVEMKATEAGTNVTPQQIEALPQPDRNFLRMAQLAPGVAISNNPERKTFSANGLDPEQTNIFIDGVSYKNDVLLGGFAGGDSSRGNPFPQNAVQEFKVLTNNFSSEYDHASSAVITAVSKSGTNDLKGEAFLFYLPKGWVEDLNTNKGNQFFNLSSNPSYRRSQWGVQFGGPIIKDHLHYFASSEVNDEHGVTSVSPGAPPPAAQDPVTHEDIKVKFPTDINLASYAGTFASPFRENLFFGKLNWEPLSNQLVDFTGSYRNEKDIRGFGTQSGNITAYERAENIRNWVYDVGATHHWTGTNSFNQATLTWQKYGWNPTAVNNGTPALNYFGVINIGGKDTTQRFEQRRIELRDKYTTAAFKWMGDHTLEAGGNADFMHYDISKCQDCNPIFNFHYDPNANPRDPNFPKDPTKPPPIPDDYSSPFEAFVGFGNPNLSTSNNEYGFFVQDGWVPTPRLNVNLGLRWDYETGMLDKGYVTPANIVAALTGKVDSSYFSNGSNRSSYKGEWQPRLGASFDVFGNSRSIIFGGFGRYYDRLFLNATLDERFRLQFPVYRIAFSNKDFPAVPGKVVWDPKYQSFAGLQALVAQGAASPEIFLLNNNTKPPYSNQWNLGWRQALGMDFTGSVSYNVTRGYRGFTWLSATGLCCSQLAPGYGNVIISDPEGKRFWYNGLFVTLERPYASQSRWGARIAWTHSKAEQNGNDLFSLDWPSASQYPRHIVPGTERDRVVASGIFGLPFDVRLATLISLGSGKAQNVLDFTSGFSLADRQKTLPFSQSVYPPKSGGWAERTVDLSLEKAVPLVKGTYLSVRGDVFNASNSPVYGCLPEFYGPGDTPIVGEAPLAKAGCVTNVGRRYQLGLKVGF